MHTVKRIVKGFFCFCLCCVVLALGINFYVVLSTKPMMKETQDLQGFDTEFVLVLGCGVRLDGSPSHMLWERLKTGREVLIKCSETTKLLLSGDNSGSYNEPQTMQRVCLENGVPENRIVIDDFGFSTFDKDRYHYAAVSYVPGAVYCKTSRYQGNRHHGGLAVLSETDFVVGKGDPRPRQGCCAVYTPANRKIKRDALAPRFFLFLSFNHLCELRFRNHRNAEVVCLLQLAACVLTGKDISRLFRY